MNKIIFRAAWLLATVSICLTALAQQKYTIKGKINGLTQPMKLKFFYSPKTNESVEDSVIVKDGAFEMQGTIARPFYVSMMLTEIDRSKPKSNQVNWLYKRPRSFYLTGGVTTIEGDYLYDATIRNPVEDEYAQFRASAKKFEKPLGAIDSLLSKTANADTIKTLKEKRRQIVKQREKKTVEFIKAHPSSYVSFDLVKGKAIAITDADGFNEMFSSLAPAFKNSPEGKKIANNLGIARQLGVGQRAIPFTQADTAGKPVSLADLKGKYVLIDFWASWCGWCIVEYPYLKKAYAAYKDKNFEIIGVSLDDSQKQWIAAINKNSFPWIQVCDLKGRNNAVAKAYGVTAIPRNFLIDPNGVIVAKDLRREALIEKLNEIYSN